ncbi:MAG: hypothetical protein B7733_25985 [Myxococcales bacterium FL481]|nr:MAG: hypothetical protein B7733_25985 [Myxococcales bacterium FL481]
MAVAIAFVGPWQLHRAAVARIGGRLGQPSRPVGVDLHANALVLRDVAIDLAQGQFRSARVRAYLDYDGLHVALDDVEGSRLILATKTRAPPRRATDRDRAAAPPSAETQAPRPTLPFNPPLPLRLHATGTIAVDTDRPGRAFVDDIAVDLLPGPAWHLRARGELEWDGQPLGAYRAEARATPDDDVGFSLDLTPRQGPQLHIGGLRQARGTRLEITSGDGSAILRLGAQPRPDRFELRVEAHAFPLATLASWPLPSHWREAWRDATASGRAKIDRGPRSWHVAFDGFEVADATVHHRLLARDPLRFATVGLTGTIGYRASVWAVQAQLSHRQVTTELSGRLGPNTTAWTVRLPTTPCQDLLDALPQGLAPLLEGMRVDGELGANFKVAFSRDVVASLPASTDHVEAPLGELEVDFPLLERCRVVADAPNIDLEALKGAYRHRFVQADGSKIERILGIESPAFTPLVQVPQLGRAFVVLEDSAFWQHDGFDREQMARAFWYNLGVGRVSRGASTITQQTARNLWLGGQRTLARKLQEAILAARLESELSKSRILELYLNIIELGPGVHGVHEAAHYHFGTDPEHLELLQALHVAALAPAPVPLSRRFASGRAPAPWRAELREQVRRMQLRGMISRETAHRAMRSGLRLRARD